jgi:hypothetical protein
LLIVLDADLVQSVHSSSSALLMIASTSSPAEPSAVCSDTHCSDSDSKSDSKVAAC